MPAATVVCACIPICTCDVHCLHSSFSTALLLQGQEVLRREAATLLARSLAAEKLAADRLVALTEKEQAADHLQQSLCDANTALAEALQVKFLLVLQYLALCCCVHETYAPVLRDNVTCTYSRHLPHKWWTSGHSFRLWCTSSLCEMTSVHASILQCMTHCQSQTALHSCCLFMACDVCRGRRRQGRMLALPLFPCLERPLHLPVLQLALPRSLGLDQQVQTCMLAHLPLLRPQRFRTQVC